MLHIPSLVCNQCYVIFFAVDHLRSPIRPTLPELNSIVVLDCLITTTFSALVLAVNGIQVGRFIRNDSIHAVNLNLAACKNNNRRASGL